DKQI
ncbi:hypothetical protein D039_3263, partial [Vibrio parahaemolyticus EKP-028]